MVLKARLGAALAGAVAAAAVTVTAAPAQAQDDFVTYHSLTVDLAAKAAQTAMQACREQGYQVAVAVVDRFGVPQVVLRDRYAGPQTLDIAAGKARTAVGFRQNTGDLVDIAAPGSGAAGLRNLPGVVILDGGLMIQAGGALVGGIGVSGAPGGDLDADCARAGLEAIGDTLAFGVN